MHRKAVSLILVVFLVFALTLTGCKRSATPKLDEIPPEDESAAMIQDAEGNTGGNAESQDSTPAEATEEPTEAATPEPTEEAGEQATEAATPEPTAEATPEPTQEATPEPTAEATPEPTVEPTPEATTEPVVGSSPSSHTVQAGENLFRIALKYGMTVDTLAKANGITNVSLIKVGQVLVIPSGAVTPPSPAPAPGGDRTHIVQPGENLFRIALKYNYDQYYLARYNGIDNPAMIYVGQAIRIP